MEAWQRLISLRTHLRGVSGGKVCRSVEVEADDVPWVETKLGGRVYMDIHVKRWHFCDAWGVPVGGERGGRHDCWLKQEAVSLF